MNWFKKLILLRQTILVIQLKKLTVRKTFNESSIFINTCVLFLQTMFSLLFILFTIKLHARNGIFKVKIPNHDKYITSHKFSRLTVKFFTATLKQETKKQQLKMILLISAMQVYVHMEPQFMLKLFSNQGKFIPISSQPNHVLPH